MQSVLASIKKWYHQLDSVFTEQEAWSLFKTSAILETSGWTMLIIGIVFKYNQIPAWEWVLALAGSYHGILALVYMAIVLFAHRSLGWSVKRFVFAELINAVPFAVLIFEMYVSRERQQKQAKA